MSKLKCGKRACGVLLLWATAAVALPAQTLTTLHSFENKDGAFPEGVLVQGTDGNLYGTTVLGGSSNNCGVGSGCGTVFKITPSGTLTRLHSFDVMDGDFPLAGVVHATNGDFYGTTAGGQNNLGYGTVFKITSSGALTTLQSFCLMTCTDGASPFAALVQGTDGNFYGTTIFGAANINFGAVFKITPSGKRTTFFNFGGANGDGPIAGLVQATDGNFYGTTEFGGASDKCGLNYDCGTVFKVTPSGTLTRLYSFCSQGGSNCTDGQRPFAGLVQATDGNFYGTTYAGGLYAGAGTAFKITPSGTLTTLHNFDFTDGSGLVAALVQGTDGNFYGTTFAGGTNGFGTAFKITTGGAVTTLYNFCSQGGFSCTDGGCPNGGLVQDTDGKFYGTTAYGGTSSVCNVFRLGCGTVFSLDVGLAPFALTQPASGPVGAAVNILGTNLTGAISVTFNGTAAAFTVVSHSLITTTVPAGATSGTVQVSNPTGTVSSNVPFTVK